MFHNLLVAVDGSDHSERALAEAIDLAQAHKGRLTIVTAVPHASEFAGFAGIDPEDLNEDLRSEYADILHRAEGKVPGWLLAETILTQDPVEEVLVERAASGEFDLLVMGSRGRGAARAVLLGSVSHHALNHVSIAVLIVHATSPSSTLDEAKTAAVHSTG